MDTRAVTEDIARVDADGVVLNPFEGTDQLGGAISAALFLTEFVSKTPWVHIDIAGPHLSSKKSGYIVKGATGVGVSTLMELALSEAKSEEAT